MNYFDKELQKAKCDSPSQLSKDVLWAEANDRYKRYPEYMWFVYILMLVVLLFCFYMLSCTVFGFGWLKNVLKKKPTRTKILSMYCHLLTSRSLRVTDFMKPMDATLLQE
ncbi:MAG: hypothetical protein IJ031_03645 [Oscillospiraceae bacterium]|nr:hypothetical protein [Oscillospiraceae bacterium]